MIDKQRICDHFRSESRIRLAEAGGEGPDAKSDCACLQMEAACPEFPQSATLVQQVEAHRARYTHMGKPRHFCRRLKAICGSRIWAMRSKACCCFGPRRVGFTHHTSMHMLVSATMLGTDRALTRRVIVNGRNILGHESSGHLDREQPHMFRFRLLHPQSCLSSQLLKKLTNGRYPVPMTSIRIRPG